MPAITYCQHSGSKSSHVVFYACQPLSFDRDESNTAFITDQCAVPLKFSYTVSESHWKPRQTETLSIAPTANMIGTPGVKPVLFPAEVITGMSATLMSRSWR